MPTTETGLVESIQKAIHRHYPDAWLFKVVGSPYQMAGVPDVLVCIEGMLIGLEAKFIRPGETWGHAVARTTAQQEIQIQRIKRSGGAAGTVTSVQEALDLIAQGLERRNRERADVARNH
jgi:hypothetical protein